MDEMIQMLKQIQDLAGAGIDALTQASKGGGGHPQGGEAPPEHGGAPAGGPPPSGPPQG